MNVREMRAQRADLLDLAGTLTGKKDGSYQALMTQIERLGQEINQIESREGLPPPNFRDLHGGGRNYGYGMNGEEDRALAAYIKGDRSALQDLEGEGDDMDVTVRLPRIGELRAVDSTMNVGTAADGGNVAPDGFSGQVAARQSEFAIDEKLGCRKVPGKGTTVDFPFENADPEVFATTAEQDDAHAQNYERDTPVFGSKAFTLVKKTKKLELTEELLADEDAEVLSFIADHIGRAIAFTRNAMLLTEVAANGTSLKTFASATVIAAGELESMAFHDTLGYYLDDGNSIGWVMRPTVHGEIASLTGSARTYENIVGANRKEILNYPVVYSNSAGATAASTKSVYLANWWYVGRRLDPALKLIRDPYTVDGLVILKYSFRACFGILIQGGAGYGVHPSA